MSYVISSASAADKDEILALYKKQLGREFCPWNEHYPTMDEIEFDLSWDSLFIMRNEENRIIAAITIDHDEEVARLACWDPELQPSGELSRLAVDPEYQNRGIAREMIAYAMDVLRERGCLSVHFLVNKHNKKALASYARLDFATVGETELFNQPFFCYEKKL